MRDRKCTVVAQKVTRDTVTGPGGTVEVSQDVSGHTELCYLDASPFLYSVALRASCLAMRWRVLMLENMKKIV